MQSRSESEFGSAKWLEHVWSSPPVDKIKGRSRWTQAHQPWIQSLARFAPVQGRHEYVSLLLLEYLHTLRLVDRFKEHAFATSEGDLGWEIRPDFFLRDCHQQLKVLEIKTARFITPAVRLQLDANREGLARFGLKYLVWSDSHPLSRPVRHNLINMRRAASEDVSTEEIDRLVEGVGRDGDMPLDAATAKGFDLVCVLAAWWQGRVFLPLTRDISALSTVSLHSYENFEAIFLDEKRITDDWWATLSDA